MFGRVINRVGKISGFVHSKGNKGFAMGAAAKASPPSRSTTWSRASRSSSCCFPREYSRELVSFVRRREQVTFDSRQVTRSQSNWKRIWIEWYIILVLQESPRKISPGKSGPSIKPGTWNIPEHPGTWNSYHNYEKNT